jgi:hypothetical protein
VDPHLDRSVPSHPKTCFRKGRTCFSKLSPNDGETTCGQAVPRKEVVGIYGQLRGGTNFITASHVTEFKG